MCCYRLNIDKCGIVCQGLDALPQGTVLFAVKVQTKVKYPGTWLREASIVEQGPLAELFVKAQFLAFLAIRVEEKSSVLYPAQLRKIILKEYRLPADRYSELTGQLEQALKLFKKAEQDVREGVGGRRQGGQGVKTTEGKLRAAATAHQERAHHLLGQMRGAWEQAKTRRLLKAPLPKMPPSTLPPLGKWEVTRGYHEELLHGVVFVGHPGGWEVYDLVGGRCTTWLPRQFQSRAPRS